MSILDLNKKQIEKTLDNWENLHMKRKNTVL